MSELRTVDFIKLQSEYAAMNPWPLVVTDPEYQTLVASSILVLKLYFSQSLPGF